MVDVERLRHFVTALIPVNAEAIPENEGWSLTIPGLPLAVEANTFQEAVEEMVDALREYAEDWQMRLGKAPNHRQHWGLVQLIGISTDNQLREWIGGDRAGASLLE